MLVKPERKSRWNQQSAEELFVVTAFTGLGATLWVLQARGVFGFTRGTTKMPILLKTCNPLLIKLEMSLITMKEDTGHWTSFT